MRGGNLNILAILGICPEVEIKSPGFIVLVAIINLIRSPLATAAILAVLQGSYWMLITFSTNGGPSLGPCRQLSTHLYLFLCPPPSVLTTTLPVIKIKCKQMNNTNVIYSSYLCYLSQDLFHPVYVELVSSSCSCHQLEIGSSTCNQ